MVHTDWERILSVNASSLTDEEIEDLFPAVVRCDVDEITDVHSLRTLMRLSQEMLTYKDNQVEALLLECGELKETITSLRPEPVKRKIKDRDIAIKQENDDFTKSTDLSVRASYADTQGKSEKVKTLMIELESLDKENEILKGQLTTLKDEMEDATEKMNEMTEELRSTQIKAVEYKDKILKLEQENIALAGQIEEIAAQQEDRDKMLDEFSEAIDARISEWKAILDEKDTEIAHLKESLSQSLMQSVTSAKEENKSQIIHLNDEIVRRDTIIVELQTKLSEAVVEINESATLIERLKRETQGSVKSDKRKEQKNLLKKIQSANEKISNLENALSQAQDDAMSQSSKLCEVLSTLKMYEDGNEALTRVLNEIKELKIKLDHKNEHLKDLVNVVNKLEMLNSYQEMEILTLREKLGIPEDESISIKGVLAKRKEESRKLEELIQQNKSLIEENLELKSDIRMLKYKLSKSEKILDISDNLDESSKQFLHSTKLVELENIRVDSKPDISEVNQNIQILIEENEALRTGMHEIMDSIRNQDGKSEVEIQSSTLERLLEALDVRHLAGWYHPAMRLQEYLNVIQGSNAELRSQLRLLRKELQKKDDILQDLATNRNIDVEKLYEKYSEDEAMTIYLTEMKALQTAYKNEAEEWEKQKDILVEENNELKDEIDGFKKQLDIYKKSWQIIESGDDEVQKAFAIKTKEYAYVTNEIIVMNRKNASLQQLLNKKTSRLYECQKEIIKKESDLNRSLVDTNKYKKILLSEVSLLQSNLCNSVSIAVHNELKERYEELNIRHRALLETALMPFDRDEISSLKAEIEAIRQEKYQLVENLRQIDDRENSDDLQQRLKEIEARELIERQRADQMARLHEISQAQLIKCEDNVKQLSASNSELQEKLIEMHKKLSKEVALQEIAQADDNYVQELRNGNAKLTAENESLKTILQISREEAQLQYSLNSLQTLELDSLRHQILNLQAVSEDKATISRLDFELTSKKISEMELTTQKTRLQDELSSVQQELDNSTRKCEEMRGYVQDYRKQCDNRCKYYIDIIYFLQCQYAGSTSISNLEKVTTLAAKLKTDRKDIDSEIQKVKKCHEEVKHEQQLLSTRLEIVERLKDILEQQIGAGSVQNIMEHFAETSQQTLSDFKYKRRITHLEHELQIVNSKFSEYESVIINMEQDMVNIQRAWYPQQQDHQPQMNASNFETKSVQVAVKLEAVSVQTDPYTCCLSKKRKDPVEEVKVSEDIQEPPESSETVEKEIDKKKTFRETGNNTEESGNSTHLNEQLDQALKLASERSEMLAKYESQLTEYQTKMDTLTKAIEEKDTHLAQKQNVLDELMSQPRVTNIDFTDKLALKSTINSLQKLIAQKEETILRYQNLLKEDRDEHSRAASRFQDEIKSLHDRILAIQSEVRRNGEPTVTVKKAPEKTSSTCDEITSRTPRNRVAQEEEIARLREKVSTYEAELNISKELSERWHRLAEERLEHMDRMRERLEQQHKMELESYRGELNKWQTEAETLRQQLSENRVLLTKGNISLMKELQEKDDRIHELNLACQQLQNEIELIESVSRSQQMISVQSRSDAKTNETAYTSHRDQAQQQNQTDLLRRQLQSLMEKEKMYKCEITDLKQQLSRRYMATKTQEKKISQREAQLERKVTTLEEELHKAKTQLDREYLAQEVKKAKTAEELALWEKQKKWQQTAERLKEKLKQKTDEYEKLLTNYEKLRAVVSCMEREKWYLRSKLKFENDNISSNVSARLVSNVHHNTAEELEKECLTLRERVKELTDRLEKKESNEQLMSEMAELKRRNATLEAVTQGNNNVISQLEKLEMTKDILEKMNLKLESENFELRLELEKANSHTPRLREKVEHLEKYIRLLKAEKSSDSTSTRSSDKDLPGTNAKKSTLEMEKTIFTLKRIVERLQAENKRLKFSSKKNHFLVNQGKTSIEGDTLLQRQYEISQKRVISLESDLRLAEQRVAMLEKAQKEDDCGDLRILKQQLNHKSELLEKVKQLLTRAAINEKTLRQRVQQLESKQALSTIPECYVTPPTPE